MFRSSAVAALAVFCSPTTSSERAIRVMARKGLSDSFIVHSGTGVCRLTVKDRF
ncbi:hypothetical protein D3C75_1326020 [compost metagenome]